MFDTVGDLSKREINDEIPAEMRGIRALISAILERALFDYFGSDDYFSRESDAWIFSDDTKEWSFAWLCDALDFCPKKIRQKIKTQELNQTCQRGNFRKRWNRHRVTRSQPSL